MFNTKGVAVRCAHSSGQRTDTTAQQTYDVMRLITRMKKRQWRWLTGTEAVNGQSHLEAAWQDRARANGLVFHKGSEVWIVHPKDLFDGPVDTEYHEVAPGQAKKWESRGVLRVTGHSPMVGSDLTILAAHYVTNGAPGPDNHRADERQVVNQRIARKVGTLGRTYGLGSRLCFYGGDQNIIDRKEDTFLGEPFTSLWDELGHYENTGHGNIDVIASYDHDHRVKGLRIQAFDDSEFSLNSDHYLVEGEFSIKRRKP